MNQWYTPQDHNADESQNNYAKWKKPDPFTKKKKREHIPCDSIYPEL